MCRNGTLNVTEDILFKGRDSAVVVRIGPLYEVGYFTLVLVVGRSRCLFGTLGSKR